jgi:hypothetical protein
MKDKFTVDEESKILALSREHSNINDMIRKFYDNEKLDVRSREGRLIKAFLLRNGVDFKVNTTPGGGQDEYQFSDSQLAFLNSDQVNKQMNTLEIARLVFNDVGLQALNKEHRAVTNWVKANKPEILNNESPAINKWLPTRILKQLISKVNEYCHVNLQEDKLSKSNKEKLEALRSFMDSPRVTQTINQFETEDDRTLFESEFVRSTWDKPDLTNDELNLYINVCVNYVRIKHLQSQINKLNKMFSDHTSDADQKENDIPMRLSEAIKAKSSELNQCEVRVENLIKKLNGDRAARIEKSSNSTISISSVIAAWQDEEERKRMINIAEMKRLQNEKAADELESMEEWKARILGLYKDDIV